MSVILGDRTLNTIFIVVLTILIVIANALMGCELNLEVVKETLKKPVAPAIGLICQFVLMPMVS